MLRLACAEWVTAVMVAIALAPCLGAAAETKPVLPPQNWLAALHTPSLSETRALVEGLPRRLLGNAPGLFMLVDAAIRGIDPQVLGDGPVVVGLVGSGEAASDSSEPFLFALLSPPDFPALVAALGGEQTGASAIVDRNGLAFTLTPFGGRVIVVIAEHEQRLARLRPAEAPLPISGGIGFSASRDGFRYLASRAEAAEAAKRAASRRRLRLPWRWPPRLVKLDAVFGLNPALWRSLGGRFEAFHVSLDSGEQGALIARVRLDRTETRTPDRLPASATELVPADWQGVFGLRAGAASLWLPDLLAGLTAYQQGRPDEVRAREFAAEPFAEYSSRLQKMAQKVEAVEAELLLPADGEPAEANHLAVLRTADAPALIDAIGNVAEAWNSLLDSSKARDKLLFERRTLDAGGLRGVELRADMVAAAGVQDTPEMRALLHRYVGNDGWLSIRVARLADDRVLVTDASLQAALRGIEAWPQDAGGASEGASANIAVGNWSLDRHLAWLATLDRLQNADTLGWKPAPAMAPVPPVAINLRADGGRIELELRAPAETVRALGSYLEAN